MSTVRIQLRRGLASEWATADAIGDGVVLAPGEVGFITDENTFKVGNGDDKFGDLPYILESSLGDYIPMSQFGTPSGVATLDSNGILSTSQLPALAKVTVASAANQSARLALTAEPGDIAIQADNGQSYVLKATPASTDSNWQALVGSEAVVDTVEAALVAGTGLDKTYNDTDGTITIDIDSTVATKTYADNSVNSGISTHNSDITNVHGIEDTSALATKAYADNAVTVAVAGIVSTAPETLNTLNEIATALGNDANYSASVTAALGGKLAKAGGEMQGAIDMGSSNKIIRLATPTDLYDAATKKYVDDQGANYDINGAASQARIDAELTASGALTAHNDDTMGVHGIANTAALTTSDQVSASIESAIGTHNSDSTNVHGVGDMTALATRTYADDAVETAIDAEVIARDAAITTAIGTEANDRNTAIGTAVTAHNDDTTNVHGIADTSALATKSYADTAEADAITAAGSAADTKISTAIAALTKSSVGLGNVDNTSDESKPVSTAQATAIATAKSEAIADATAQVNAVIASAPAALNTLDELAAALGDDANFATTVTNGLAAKAPINAPTFTGLVTVAASGVAFTDGTQTKEGVPSRTVIGTTIAGAYNLSTGGLALRDQLIPVSGTHAITVPTNATTAYPIGTSISFYQSAGTDASFVEASGVTILRTPGLKLRATSSSATITKVATDTWLLAGDLKA
jgi:hypothetical protein